jgi:hypothetical protein
MAFIVQSRRAPKKSASFCFLAPPLRDNMPPQPRRLSHKVRAEKDLVESVGHNTSSDFLARRGARGVFWGAPQKSHPFLAPQKSQKSPPQDREDGRRGLFSRGCGRGRSGRNGSAALGGDDPRGGQTAGQREVGRGLGDFVQQVEVGLVILQQVVLD